LPFRCLEDCAPFVDEILISPHFFMDDSICAVRVFHFIDGFHDIPGQLILCCRSFLRHISCLWNGFFRIRFFTTASKISSLLWSNNRGVLFPFPASRAMFFHGSCFLIVMPHFWNTCFSSLRISARTIFIFIEFCHIDHFVLRSNSINVSSKIKWNFF